MPGIDGCPFWSLVSEHHKRRKWTDSHPQLLSSFGDRGHGAATKSNQPEESECVCACILHVSPIFKALPAYHGRGNCRAQHLETEGFTTRDLQEAQVLLQELNDRSGIAAGSVS